MRTVVITALFFIILLLVIPWVVGQFQAQLPSDLDVNITVKVWNESQEKLVNMPLGEYLVGVVAAEMPANFDLEALRAQVVAARTYVYRRLKLYGGTGCQRQNADVCTLYSCCQAYYSKEELKNSWGSNYDKYYRKIAQAVASTEGWILVYNNLPIDPLFHSTCGGHTENSGEVWQKEIPYLQSVNCPYCTKSPKYQTTIQISSNQAATILAADNSMILPVATLKATLPAMSVYQKTATGRVSKVKIGNVVYAAVQLRRVLQLNSTWFTWDLSGNDIVFKIRGYGHGVGMCQYGANGMAAQGYDCQGILEHYYLGANLRKIAGNK